MRWILLIVMVAGCGDTFESQLFLEGETDGQAGAIGTDSESDVDVSIDGPAFDATSDSDRGFDSADSGMGDSSPIEAGSSGDGDASDATPDTTEVIPCPSPQCDAYCASLNKEVQCYDGVNVCYCWPL